MLTILENCRLYEPRSQQLLGDRHLVIEAGKLREVSDRRPSGSGARRIDARGRVVLPGLIDAHFHAIAAELNPIALARMPVSLRAQYARRELEATLQRGFTTVRDAAGADIGLKLAIERGLIAGPRLYFSGRAISQTGGHGDLRASTDAPACGCSAGGAFSLVVDGADAVRAAVREELRRGATQIKIFVSGGVLSPSDPLDMAQLSDAELTAAVQEARTRHTYVMAHAHTAEAVRRCIAAGVRSIEHATMLDADTARVVVAHDDVFVVPTLAVLEALCLPGLGLLPEMQAKAIEVNRHALGSLALLYGAGARIGFGTDLLGPLMSRQSTEFQLRREVMSAGAVLTSATLVNAQLLNAEGVLGELVPGAAADLVVVDGDPLENIGVLADPAGIALVMRSGQVYRDLLGLA